MEVNSERIPASSDADATTPQFTSLMIAEVPTVAMAVCAMVLSARIALPMVGSSATDGWRMQIIKHVFPSQHLRIRKQRPVFCRVNIRQLIRTMFVK